MQNWKKDGVDGFDNYDIRANENELKLRCSVIIEIKLNCEMLR